MIKRLLLCAAALLWASPAWATWSIIAIDGLTGEIVMASATCVSQDGFARAGVKGLMDVQAIIVPGWGVAAAQAGVDWTHKNQMLIYRELHKGTDPVAILAMLKEDPAIETRQFAILDHKGRVATFSGSGNLAASLAHASMIRTPKKRIYYSIQGNILKSDAVVSAADTAFRRASGVLTDRVMAAMEAADAMGGDKRCSCDSTPRVNAPCTAKSAHVAYLVRALRGDKAGASHNDGTYSLYLSVTDADITPAEDANPVKTLRLRYDAWKKTRH
jgi:uncharacterized Ntn-hydrolase superfamily protein